MFLHKLDILNRNLNGLFQKFLLVVPKLCAVTKLGDLTVVLLLRVFLHANMAFIYRKEIEIKKIR
jgi:hypothetical protein